jgi:perosamine synthetase
MIYIAKPHIEEEEKKAVMEVLDSGMLAQGKRVAQLEERFAKFCSTEEAIAVNSGTAGIHAGLYALGIRAGDEVITVPFTFVATANPILMQNGKVVFADIKPDTFNIDPESVKEKITNKTKAIIPVDLYGQIYDAKAIREIAHDHGIKILEDACQSVNASLDGEMAGSLGDIASFSFYATKNLITGEGGMITTNNKEYAELCRRFRHHGQSQETRYEYYDLGYNYRMMDLQAAIALVQLDRIEALTQKRIENADFLSQHLSKLEGIVTPYVKSGARHVFHQYTIKVEEGFRLTRDELKEKLNEKGIGSGVYYPKPLHLHKFYMEMGYQEGDFPVSEEMSRKVLSLPVHPDLTQADLQSIVDAFNELA